MIKDGFDLIVTIVNKGWSSTVIEASQEAGARGATVLKARGSGLKDLTLLFGIPIEPEKDVILCAVPEDISRSVLKKIANSAALCKPGAGISFKIPISGETKSLYYDRASDRGWCDVESYGY